MEIQKRNGRYYKDFLAGSDALKSTWYLEELKFSLQQQRKAREERKLINKLEDIDAKLSEVRQGKVKMEQLLSHHAEASPEQNYPGAAPPKQLKTNRSERMKSGNLGAFSHRRLSKPISSR